MLAATARQGLAHLEESIPGNSAGEVGIVADASWGGPLLDGVDIGHEEL